MSSSSKSAGAKLLWLTVLAATGLVATATAATVFAAGDLQRLHARDGASASLRLEGSRNLLPLRALADSLVATVGVAELGVGSGSRARSSAVDDSRNTLATDAKALQRLVIVNEAAADSALLAGDAETALLRARENIGAAQHLLWRPQFAEAAQGRAMMLSGAKLLARAALQAQQHTLHASAQRLVVLTSAMQPVPLALQSGRARPNDSTLQAWARDRSLHPATRVVAIELMVASACRSPREVLFGPTLERHAAIDAMISAASDIPQLAQLRSGFHRALDRLDEDPPAFTIGFAVAPSMVAPSANVLLRVLVPDIVEARIDACRGSGA